MALSGADRLKLEIDADTKSFEAGLARAQKSLQSYESSVRRGMAAVVELDKEMGQESARAARLQSDALAASAAAAKKHGDEMQKAGRVLMGFGLAGAAAFALSAREAMRWESAWAGVTKTVDDADDPILDLERGLRDLALVLPASAGEIAGVAEAAGALGVKRESIESFTKVMIDLGETTNLTAEEAATSIAQMMNVMGTAPDKVGNLGAALVALGNAGASTEADILDMAQRIAGAGAQIGLSEADVLGFANALTSVGIKAEAGGTAISSVFKDISKAVSQGGEGLENFATVAGVSSAAFAQSFRDDPAAAMQMFIEGLGGIQDAGGDVFTTLDDLNFTGERVGDVLLRMSGNTDLVAESVALGNKAWLDNLALIEEAAKRYETTEAKVQMAKNALADSAITIGESLLPVIAALAEGVSNLAKFFGDLPGPVQGIVIALGGLLTLVALVGGAMMIAVPKIAAFKLAASTMTGALGGAARGMGMMMGVLGGPLGIALGAAAIGLGFFANAQGAAKREADALNATLDQQTGAVTDSTATLLAKTLADNGMLEDAAALGIAEGDLTAAILGNEEAMTRVTAAIDANSVSQRDNQHAGRQAYGTMTDLEMASGSLRHDLDEQTGSLKTQADEIKRNSAETKAAKGIVGELAGAEGELGEATGETAEIVAEATDRQKELAEKFNISEEAAGDLEKRLDGLKDSYDRLMGIEISAIEAGVDYQAMLLDNAEVVTKIKDEMGGLSEAVTDGGAAFETNTEAGILASDTMTGMATEARDLASAILDETGSEAAWRDSLNSSREDLYNLGIELGLSEEAARALTDKILGVPAEVPIEVEPHYFNETELLAINTKQKVDALEGVYPVAVAANTAGALEAIRIAQERIDALHGKTIFVDVDWQIGHLPEGVDGTRSGSTSMGSFGAMGAGERGSAAGTFGSPLGGGWGTGSSSASYDYSSSMSITAAKVDFEALRRFERLRAQRARAFAGARS